MESLPSEPSWAPLCHCVDLAPKQKQMVSSLQDAASTRCTESHQTVMVIQNRAQTPVLPSPAANKQR